MEALDSRTAMRRDSRQQPLFAVATFMPRVYEPGSFFDVLALCRSTIFRRSDFAVADRVLGGEEGWCPVLLSCLVLLQQKHGWTDREAVQRACYDLQVKACLGLGVDQSGPSQPTLCRHRQLMQQLGLDQVYSDRMRDLLEALELVSDDEPLLIDSVPINGAGQQQDTYNLLASAIRRGLKELAHKQQLDLDELASDLGLAVYLKRSVKGQFDVNWEDEGSRREFLARLVADARRIRDLLSELDMQTTKCQTDGDHAGRVRTADDQTGESKGGKERTADDQTDKTQTPGGKEGKKRTADDQTDKTQTADDQEVGQTEHVGAAALIDSIVSHDIVFDEAGQVEGIRQVAANDRLISTTDPDMRHGRKSASHLIAGFKAQVVASLAFGFIVLSRLIKANAHDGEELPHLVDEVEKRHLLNPKWWCGDHAYGTLANHRFFEQRGGELVARMARPSNGGRFTKDEFAYCFDTHTLTCPAGHQLSTSRWMNKDKRRGRLFEFSASICSQCPMRERCMNPKATRSGRTVFVVDDDDRLIRRHLEEREQESFRRKLHHRAKVERVIAGFAQCGGKEARRFGEANVGFDVNLSALAYNLRTLGSLLARDPSLARSLEKALRGFFLYLRTVFASSAMLHVA